MRKLVVPTGQLRAVGWVPSRRPAPWPLDRSGIVVFGQPMAIEGSNEDCVRLHRSWTFYDWNPTAGMGAARIGAGQVERVELIAPRAGLFERAPGSVALDPSSVGY